MSKPWRADDPITLAASRSVPSSTRRRSGQYGNLLLRDKGGCHREVAKRQEKKCQEHRSCCDEVWTHGKSLMVEEERRESALEHPPSPCGKVNPFAQVGVGNARPRPLELGAGETSS